MHSFESIMPSWNPDASHAQSGVPNAALIVGMHYTPYGYQPAAERAALLGFTGQCREPVTGGYLLGRGHRLYSPELMRFTSPDNLSPFGRGGINAFSYCAGDPVNRFDPTGRAWSSSGILKWFRFAERTGLTESFKKLGVAAEDIPGLKEQVKGMQVGDADRLIKATYTGVENVKYTVARTGDGLFINNVPVKGVALRKVKPLKVWKAKENAELKEFVEDFNAFWTRLPEPQRRERGDTTDPSTRGINTPRYVADSIRENR